MVLYLGLAALTSPFLSVIIPAHNEQNRLPHALGQVFEFLNQQDYSFEVLVVENASTDNTFITAQVLTRTYPDLVILHEDLPGKGRAVRRGILEARGNYRFLADADLSMPVEEINRFLPPACQTDIAIASREAPGAIRHNEPVYRHLTGRVYNFLIRSLILPHLQDTQCGFKCFRGPVAEELFPCQTLDGWSFDVEILYLAHRRGYSVSEIGIPWYYNPDSKLNVIHDSAQMFLDLLTIRRNARRGIYDPQR